MILESFIMLGLARAAVLALPFRWLAKFLGKRKDSVKDDELSKDKPSPMAMKIAWIINKTSQYTPWDSNCLAKAVAGRFMLKRRKISGTVYFGMAKDSEGELEAHAWLRSGNKVLTGDTNLDQYAIVAIFSD